MTDYFTPEHVEEENLDPQYRELEEAYRNAAAPLWQESRRLAEDVRSNVESEQEQREEQYLSRHRANISAPWQQLASKFVETVETQRYNDRQTVEASRGPRFGDHLVAVATTPDDGLETLLETARRTGEKDLARAVAQTALDRNRFGVFNKWANSEPEVAAAMKRLRSLPGQEQLITRTEALKPPVADPEQLVPREADIAKAKEQKRLAEHQRRQNFSHGNRRITAHGTTPLPNRP